MALCDRLEAQQQERETRHAALARASLARFADAPTPANLQFLFHPSYTIPPADLRKSILTLAVQGKLVPQDPNDEPAEASARQIRSAQVALPKEGKTSRLSIGRAAMCRRRGPSSSFRTSWCWTRFGEIMVEPRRRATFRSAKMNARSRLRPTTDYGASRSHRQDRRLSLRSSRRLAHRRRRCESDQSLRRPWPFIEAREVSAVNNPRACSLTAIFRGFLQFIELHIERHQSRRIRHWLSARRRSTRRKMNSIPIAAPTPRRTTPDRGQSGSTDGLGGRVGNAARRLPRHRREPPRRPRRRTHHSGVTYAKSVRSHPSTTKPPSKNSLASARTAASTRSSTTRSSRTSRSSASAATRRFPSPSPAAPSTSATAISTIRKPSGSIQEEKARILNTDQFPRNLARFDELKRSCQRGFVIPFVGAGMSKSAGCPEWKEYLLNLCIDADLDPDAMRDRLEENGDYEGVMNELVTRLGENRFNLDFERDFKTRMRSPEP